MIKFKIGDKFYSPNEEPVMMIFEDDEDIKSIIMNLKNMLLNTIVGERKYVLCPQDMSDNDIEIFSGIKFDDPKMTPLENDFNDAEQTENISKEEQN